MIRADDRKNHNLCGILLSDLENLSSLLGARLKFGGGVAAGINIVKCPTHLLLDSDRKYLPISVFIMLNPDQRRPRPPTRGPHGVVLPSRDYEVPLPAVRPR